MLRTSSLLSLSLAAVLTVTGPALAQSSNDLEPQLRIERDGGGAHNSGAFQFEISNPQRQYRLKERISFQVSGNQKFFVWAYTVEKNGRAIILVPSAGQHGNQYSAGTHRLPNPGISFYADEIGPHQITIIASNRWLEIDNWLQRNAQKSGDLMEIPAAEIEKAFSEMGVQIGSDRRSQGRQPSAANAEVVVRYLDFDVTQ